MKKTRREKIVKENRNKYNTKKIPQKVIKFIIHKEKSVLVERNNDIKKEKRLYKAKRCKAVHLKTET